MQISRNSSELLLLRIYRYFILVVMQQPSVEVGRSFRFRSADSIKNLSKFYSNCRERMSDSPAGFDLLSVSGTFARDKMQNAKSNSLSCIANEW